MKKMHWINTLPVALWVVNFVFNFICCSFQYYEEETFDVLFKTCSYINLALFTLIPIIFIAINIFARKHKDYLISNIILAFSCAIGYFIYGILYYVFISTDGATLAIAVIATIVLFEYVFLLTAIGFIIKSVVNKIKNRRKSL